MGDYRKEIGQVARGMRGVAKRVGDARAKRTYKGIVLVLDPLTVELVGSEIVLVEHEDLEVSQHVRKYDRDHSIQVGESVLVNQAEDGDMIVVDVVTDKHTFEGFPTQHEPGEGLLGEGTDGTPYVGTVPFYDADENIIGRVPLLPP